MLYEAFERIPMETGGILLGRRQSSSLAVIHEAIGPGPGALHARTAFDPDQVWQEEQVADAWQRHDGRIDYLGDWHTHPRGRASLSQEDKSCMKLIRDSDEARAPQPLMLVLAVNDQGRLRARAWLLDGDRLHRARIVVRAGAG